MVEMQESLFLFVELEKMKIELLQESFGKVLRRRDEFIASFYERLFTMYPEVIPLFEKVNMVRQREKLLAALVTIVNNLRRPEILAPYLKELGRHHIDYHVRPEYFPMVGAALLATFEAFLGNDWTDELKDSWGEAYNEAARLMIEGYK